ncbi:DUF2924 domain-containing protein [Ruegeria profundi]|uniref:DUF2924 domain-containing protein n=1 Tax=Ruegeria profundi TaxID=1685378 RepID=UPI001CD7F645|nr:DUF2924 domain-containing protein [Ruegeria profundi]MCA0928772.1 DUF2924 domain-containing protein [Ruegeria profundi]
MKRSLAEIETMDRAALIVAWDAVFGTPVPKRLSSPFLRRYLAFEMQAREYGGLPKGFVGKLTRAVGDNRGTSSPALKPGGRLIREWNGVTHVVDVIDGGFVWNGQRYASLSPIARAITGARWSGPRFFGLKKVI